MKERILQENKKRILIWLGIIVFWGLYYWVVIQSSYTADDRLNATVAGVNYMNDSVWALTGRQFGEWIRAGRFFPFANYTYLLFAYIPSRACYKALLIGSLFLGSLLLAQVVIKVSGSREFGDILMMVIPLCMQLTGEFGSALYCYQMLVQLTWIWICLSLLSALKVADIDRRKEADRKKRIGYKVVGGLTLILALGTYEVAFVLAVFAFVVVWAYTGNIKHTLRTLIPQFIGFSMILMVNIGLRLGVRGTGYTGITIHFSIHDVVVTFLKQLWSTIPLARFCSRTLLYGVPYGKWDLLRHLKWTDILLIGIMVSLLLYMNNRLFAQAQKVKKKQWILIIGLLIMLLPPILISISAKYQTVLDWGIGHITTLIQSLGLAVTILTGILLVTKNKPRIGHGIIVGLIILNIPIVLMQEMEARTSVDIENLYYRYPYENIQNAGNMGIFDVVDQQEPVVLMSDYYFDREAVDTFYALAAKKKLNILNQQTAEAERPDIAWYVWSYADQTNGCVVLGQDGQLDGEQKVQKIYLYINDGDVDNVAYIKEGEWQTLDLTTQKKVKEAEEGVIYELMLADIDMTTVKILKTE